MQHLLGYYESIDAATLAPITALSDPSLTISGDNVQVPEFASQLMGMYALGANITRAQLQSPSLRRILNPEIIPLDVAAEPTTDFRGNLFPEMPIALEAGEQLTAHIAEDAAGVSDNYVFVWLSDGAIAPVSGEMFTVRVTNSDTLNANKWTNGSMVFDQTLPVGTYALVGARFESANLIAFRFLFQGFANRPGGIGCDGVSDKVPEVQRRGGLGVWGQFDSRTPPTVDFFSSVADSAQVGYLDLVKVG